ncbi:hypothetical protein RND81_14G169900 [Saponaria officinalis]|uniref:F-box domain-containing protein n=1 Tax=Saponaria officinalis TaxID=3572 RepID=A0AAW1GMW5_SAPOF
MVTKNNIFESLCEDVFINILCRLPMGDVLRCKCVSKEWHQFVSYVYIVWLSAKAPISGIYFRVAKGKEVPFVATFSRQDAKDQQNHVVAYNQSVHYVASAPLKPDLVPYWYHCFDKPSSPEMSLASLLPFDHRGPDFLDSCNGLLLFVERPRPQYFVCNPAIRQCVPVPLPPSSVQLTSLYASLAFDPSESTEYRLVISSLTTQPQCLHVFYSQTGEWKTNELQLEPLTSSKSFKLVRHSVYMKNKVYRLSMFCKILCFDLESMKARVLNCPSQKSPSCPRAVKAEPPPGCIGVSNGVLMYVIDEDEYVCIWLLRKSNESSEWILKNRICSLYLWKSVKKTCFLGRMVWLRYCGFHPTSDILFLGTVSAIYMYHMGSGHLEAVRHLGFYEMHCGHFFPLFLHRNMFVTLKNWCRDVNAKIDDYEDIHDPWCYFEQ